MRNIDGASIIVIKLVDIKGNEASYEMNFTFVVPLLFIEDLPDMIAIAGTTSSVELPEVIVELGYQLNEIIVQPESDWLETEIYYDQRTHSLVYSPASKTL